MDEFEKYFRNHIDTIDVSVKETKAYIYSIYRGFLNSKNDLSKDSITLKYIDAKNSHNFEKFQNIGDWIFYTRTLYPESLSASQEYYNTIARSSYYKCYIILDKQWALYEEMADRFNYFVETIQPNLSIRP